MTNEVRPSAEATRRKRLGASARRPHIASLLKLITFAGIASYLSLILRVHRDGVTVSRDIPDEPQSFASSSLKAVEVTTDAEKAGEATADSDKGDEPVLEERRKDCPVPLRKKIGVYDSPSEERKGLEDVILLVSSNFQHRSFLLNWQFFANKQGLNYGIVAMDDQLHELVGVDKAVLSSVTVPTTGESEFRSKSFNAITCNKLSIVMEVMVRGASPCLNETPGAKLTPYGNIACSPSARRSATWMLFSAMLTTSS